MNKNIYISIWLLLFVLSFSCNPMERSFLVGKYTWSVNENVNQEMNYINLQENYKITYNLNNYIFLENVDFSIKNVDSNSCYFEISINDKNFSKLTFSIYDSFALVTTYKTYIDLNLIDETIKVKSPHLADNSLLCRNKSLSESSIFIDSSLNHFVVIYKNEKSKDQDTITINNQGYGYSYQKENTDLLFSKSRKFRFKNTTHDVLYINHSEINQIDKLDPEMFVVVGMGFNQVPLEAIKKKYFFDGILNVEYFYISKVCDLKMDKILDYYNSLN